MKKFYQEYTKLPKEIYILSLATMINRFGDFVVPFLALYLSQKLNLSLKTTSIIVAISGFIKIPGTYWGGKISDKIGSKKTYVICQFLAAVSILPCAFTRNAIINIPLLIIFSLLSSMVRPPTMSMISDLVPDEQRKLAFTLRYIGLNIGVAIGLLIAGFLYNYSIKLLFLGEALTTFISIIMIGILIRTHDLKRKRISNIGAKEGTEHGSIISVLLKRKFLLYYIIATSMLWIIFEQMKFTLPLTSDFRFGIKGPVYYGIFISVNAVTATIFALIQGPFTKKYSIIKVIIVGGILYVIGFGFYAFVNSFITFVIATVIWSLGEVLVMTNATVFVLNNSPENFRGRLTGVASIFFSSAGAFGMVISGWIMELYGIPFTWIILSIITIISVTLLYLLDRVYLSKLDLNLI